MRVIVTRPQAQADTLVRRLREAGVDAVALPLIQIRPVADPKPLLQAWRELDALALVMFVSANAVQQFMRHRPAHCIWPAQLLAGSTGPGTSAALRAAGVPEGALVEPLGEVFDSEALWQRLCTRDWQGRRVLIVRGEQGRDWLSERLARAGAQVGFVAAYQRHPPQLDATMRAVLDEATARPEQCLWLFSSSEAVAHLEALAARLDWSRACALASHPRIQQRARRLGFGQVDLAAFDLPSLLSRLGPQSGDA
jgi:uroporphyrinogen-III synthase